MTAQHPDAERRPRRKGGDREQSDEEQLGDIVPFGRVAPPTLEDVLDIAARILDDWRAGKRDAARACRAAHLVLDCGLVLAWRGDGDAA